MSSGVSREPAVRSFESLQPGLEVQIPFQIQEEQMRLFAEISGDYNPLHLEDAAAVAKGFSGRVVYGGLLVSQVSRLIGMHVPGRDSVWSDLEVLFAGPLYVGEKAVLRAEVTQASAAARAVKLKFRIEKGETTLVARGKATVVVK